MRLVYLNRKAENFRRISLGAARATQEIFSDCSPSILISIHPSPLPAVAKYVRNVRRDNKREIRGLRRVRALSTIASLTHVLSLITAPPFFDTSPDLYFRRMEREFRPRDKQLTRNTASSTITQIYAIQSGDISTFPILEAAKSHGDKGEFDS